MNKTLLLKSLFYLFLTVPVFSQISLPGASAPPDPEIRVSLDKESYRPGETASVKVLYTFPPGYHQTHNPEQFYLEGTGDKGILFGTTVFPEGKVDSNGDIQYYDSAELVLELLVSDTMTQGSSEMIINAHFQLCDDEGICYFPGRTELLVTLDITGDPVQSQEGGTLWLFLLMALAGGFLLNLMPCVLPLLSVKAMNLISQSGEKRPVLIKHGFLYTAGILVSFWALSLVIILLQQSGKLLGWGFHFQSPLFLTVLISVIFLFALSLFEVFILLPPTGGMNKADSLSRKKGYAGSFFTGIFAVFVATPCTAPFLGSAMGFAFSQSALVIFLIMTLTGLGLSLPFLLLGFFPGFFRILPKPGKWMDKFREFMAFLLMGTVIYLSSTLIKQIGPPFGSVLWFLLVLSLAAWIWGWSSRQSRKKLWRRIFRILPLLLILGSARYLLVFDDSESGVTVNSSSYWEQFDPDEVNSIIDEGEPLFLIFSAEWCTSCKVNERTVLNTDRAKDLFASKGIRTVKGDITVSNEEAMEWIYSQNRAGVPLYLVYLPGEEVKILPEVLSFSILEDAFTSLPDQ
ncbi:MAG: thioredoxin family protein [Spirochaetales bacterium]|nr:thioredoxin family protein [Spirochaetales bacterium]